MQRPAESRSRKTLRTTAAVVCAGSVALASPGAVADPSAAAPVPAALVDVRVGENAGQGVARVEFHGSVGSRAAIRREGRAVVVRLSQNARPDLSRLLVDPPEQIEKAELRAAGRGLEIVLTLKEGADARYGRADGAAYVMLFAPGAQDRTPRPPSERAAAAVPESGVVPVTATVRQGYLKLDFAWAAPLPAAVFRRGDAVWAVFDAKARLNLPRRPGALGPATRVRWTNGEDFTIVRIEAPADVPVHVQAEGAVWSVVLGEEAAERSDVRVTRDDAGGPPALVAALSGASRAIWITDPTVGDRVAVVPALGPAKSVSRRRSTVEAALPATAHGLAVEAVSPDVTVAVEGDLVRIGRPTGLALSSPRVAGAAQPVDELPAAAMTPGLIDFEAWSRTGEGGFLPRYRRLQALASAEAASGPDAPTTARLGLARFLVGSELSYEAIGVLNELSRRSPRAGSDPEVRALRAAARVMVGRHSEALVDLSTPGLAADRAAALWRGLAEAQQGQWVEARRAFAEGANALEKFPPQWRLRFATANARAALELNDLPAARAAIFYAVEQGGPPVDLLQARLIQARLFEAEGDTDRALRVYEAVGRARFDGVATPARLNAARLKLAKGRVTPAQAVRDIDSLRFRWRGDATELEVIRTLGQIYLDQGRYREALEALRGAGKRLPDLPAALDLQADLSTAFRALFLEGKADGLEPIQALALFYDFRELTPVGADGDEMVRRLARRLVDVDLLGQAAELLQYQVDNRLDGVAKSAVATDLASIYLMNREAEKALQALWNSRTSLLPTAMAAERRVLEARALADLGRTEHALEVLGRDGSREADDVRAEIAWRGQDWATAGAMLERRLGDRWRGDQPLSPDEERRVVRAGVAFSLAGDEAALKRLSDRYSKFTERARDPAAMRVALAGVDAGVVGPGEFTRVAAQADTFVSWIADAKKRFRDRNGPATAAAPAAQRRS